MDSDINEKYRGIYQHIISVHRRFFLRKILLNSIYFLSISLAAALLFILSNLLFNVSEPFRLIFAAGLVAWFFIFGFTRIYPSLREISSPSQVEIFHTAGRIGQTDSAVRDALLNYIQIYQDRASGGSARLKNMALSQLFQRFSHLSFRKVVKYKSLLANTRPMLAALSALLVVYVAFPVPVELALRKMVLPWKNFQEPLPVKLNNLSGDVGVLRNDPVVLQGNFEGVTPEHLFLVIEDTAKTTPSDSKQNVNKISLQVRPGGQFNYKLDHVRNSFGYYFLGEIGQPRFRNRPAISPAGRVVVRARPMVRNLQVKVVPPAYSKLPAKLLPPNDGEITTLKGSLANLHIEADKQLSGAFVLFSDSTRLPLQVAGHTANGAFKVSKNLNYAIHIFDSDSIENSDPVEYSIFPLSDEYPFAEIKQPGADVDLGDELKMPLFVELRDDYGFSGLWLKGQVIRQGSGGDSSSFRMKLPYRKIENGKAFSENSWDLTSFYMVPDDYIRYYVEVFDNDNVSGPKSFKTAEFTIRLPSLLEIMSQADQQQDDQLEKMKDVSSESKELKKKLEEINRELKKETDINWERKQQIKEQLEKQRKAMDKLSEIQKDLEDVVKQLDQNKMLNPETVEKYFEIQKMMEDLASPELKDAMEKLRQALEKSDPRELQKAMEKFQLSMEQFQKNIERTYELLKRVQLEQKMDELANLADKIKKEQDQVNQKLAEKENSPEDMNRLETKENNLQKETEFLKDKLDQTRKDYQEMMQQLSEMLEKSKAFMDQEQIEKAMEQMQQQMSSGNQQQASQSGQQISSKMQKLQNMLNMASQNMNMQQKQELAGEMQKAMQDMLSTSFQQENLARQSEKLSPASSQINEIARQQSQLQEATRRIIGQLVQISNKTFFLSPQLNQVMADIISKMDNSLEQLENRNGRQAARPQREAMAGFNRALLSLQSSMSQMSQASSASGFQEFMQQLQQMSGQQGQINQQSMSLFQKGQQGRLQLSSDDLGRLAAQQEMVRQSLQKMTDENGNRRDVLGRLGELGGEMDEVIKQLKAQNLDRKVIERQERILSRLLDAQKSVREKEYSKKRQAEWEKQAIVKSPPELREALLQKEDRLRKELMEALQEGYSPEYRELIKLYFETLSRQPDASK